MPSSNWRGKKNAWLLLSSRCLLPCSCSFEQGLIIPISPLKAGWFVFPWPSPSLSSLPTPHCMWMSRGRKQEGGSSLGPALGASPHHHPLWPASSVVTVTPKPRTGTPGHWPSTAGHGPEMPVYGSLSQNLLCAWHKGCSDLRPGSSFPKQKSESLLCLKTPIATHPINIYICFLIYPVASSCWRTKSMVKGPLCILPALFPPLSCQIELPSAIQSFPNRSHSLMPYL